MSGTFAVLLIGGIIFGLGVAGWMQHTGGWWLMRRHIGVTCPVCDGMGSTDEEEVCRACNGRRYIWE